jgi:peptide/nickel transport system substrate-binding protein
VKLSRLLGILITASFLALSLSLWRASSTTATPPKVRPQRGGELEAAIPSGLVSYNPFASDDQATAIVTALTQGSLVRINPATFDLEPWLAERWDASADARVFTMHLRRGVVWSDGEPLTADDVLFSLKTAYDRRSTGSTGRTLLVAGLPIKAVAQDPSTVVLTYPASSGPGLRLLDRLTILPRHKLDSGVADGATPKWDARANPGDIVGTGPFIVREHDPGKRLVLDRNPRYWRKSQDGQALPYLDRIVLDVIVTAAEIPQLQNGKIDLIAGELPADAYVAARRAEDQGTLAVVDLGVATTAPSLWFSLKSEAKRSDPRFVFTQKPQFRQALSHAVDREMLADEVFQSAAVPIWGPVTPGNRPWFWASVPRYPYDPRKASALLQGIGLEDRDHNGIVEDEHGVDARYAVMTRRGDALNDRALDFIRTAVGRIGVALDVTPLDDADIARRLQSGAYDAAFLPSPVTGLDPADNLGFWLSSGNAHVWNPSQRTPGTDWERRIDTIVLEQAATPDASRRRELFNTVQQILAENVPVLYFVAPRLYYAHSARVIGVTGSVLRPHVLWDADSLAVTGPRRPTN